MVGRKMRLIWLMSKRSASAATAWSTVSSPSGCSTPKPLQIAVGACWSSRGMRRGASTVMKGAMSVASWCPAGRASWPSSAAAG
eukprot:15143767-Alexandrium_andersonii.AAC.1